MPDELTPAEIVQLRKELKDWKALIAKDGWERLHAVATAMRESYLAWVDAQVDFTPDGSEYGRFTGRQGECKGRKALLEYVPARIAELEALLPPE